MLKAYKYRIYPDENQKVMLAQAFGCARLLYNSLLGWWNDEYAAAKRENRHMENLPLVTHFKKEYPFLKDVDSLALMNARRNFENPSRTSSTRRRERGTGGSRDSRNSRRKESAPTRTRPTVRTAPSASRETGLNSRR